MSLLYGIGSTPIDPLFLIKNLTIILKIILDYILSERIVIKFNYPFKKF